MANPTGFLRTTHIKWIAGIFRPRYHMEVIKGIDMDVRNPAGFGSVVFGSPQVRRIQSSRDPRFSIDCEISRGEWRPPERIAGFLPPTFSVPLECSIGADGVRRIRPLVSWNELIDLGFVGGLAVIQGIRGFDSHVDAFYRAMHLVYRHVRGRGIVGERGSKDHFVREFRYSRDIFIRRSGRPTKEQRDVLPDSIGRFPGGQGRRWTTKELMERGRCIARDAGHANPISEHAIQYGLLEAARRNPLRCREEDVRRLVFAALFDLYTPSLESDEATIDEVSERLRLAMHLRLRDGRRDFDSWFFSSGNSIVKQIANQKKRPLGVLPLEQVRIAMRSLALRAYDYVGPCIHSLMRTIKWSIPDPLDETERRTFELVYERQPAYGNLPLAMLCERLKFLRPAILAIWNEPENQDHIGVLHRLLSYYADMATARRVADRQFKAVRQRASTQIVSSPEQETCLETDVLQSSQISYVEVPFVEGLHSVTERSEGPLNGFMEHLRRLAKIECINRCTNWESDVSEVGDRVVVDFSCECGAINRRMQNLGKKNLRAVLNDFLDD